ncbi:hypothetical protein BX600DRAFT_527177 [Xylariales sp. PMI_506]|nr:hypothetical protein BX600DRAFT_527177 [Xylariales sp. PMI_506]
MPEAENPSCQNCRKASATCIDGDSRRIRDLPPEDEVIVRLRGRVAYLESVLREQLPAFAHGSAFMSPDVGTAADPETGVHPARSPAAAATSRPAPPAAPGVWQPDSCDALSHEIGLVSVGSSSAPRYIGPSSGYFLSRMLMRAPRQRNNRNRTDLQRTPAEREGSGAPSRPALATELVSAAHGPLPLPERARAYQFCDAYFESVGPQYPILRRPPFMHLLERMYDGDEDCDKPCDVATFQVFMVLGIGATVLSHRLNLPLSGESYCQTALARFDQLNVDNSLPAAALDLGLQRNITTDSGISVLEQETRTRIFWVVFTLDRTIATIMGRPIGLRDEACEFRVLEYSSPSGKAHPTTSPDAAELASRPSGYMAFPLHLFKLAKLNSEIKYVANSIVRDTPLYAYPAVADIQQWQSDMAQRLDDWERDIPSVGVGGSYMVSVCKIRYHSLKMLLMRPSPAIPNPSAESLKWCYDSCRSCINLYYQMYREDLLIYSWTTLHSLLLSIVTMLYCIRAAPSITGSIDADLLMSDLCSSLGLLSAAGEHWPGAKRCRNALDDLASEAVRWVRDTQRWQQERVQAERVHDGVGAGPAAVRYEQGENAAGINASPTAPHAASGVESGYPYSILTPHSSLTITPNLAFGVSGQSFPTSQEQGAVGGMGSGIEEWWTGPLAGAVSITNPPNVDALMHSFFADLTTINDMF